MNPNDLGSAQSSLVAGEGRKINQWDQLSLSVARRRRLSVCHQAWVLPKEQAKPRRYIQSLHLYSDGSQVGEAHSCSVCKKSPHCNVSKSLENYHLWPKHYDVIHHSQSELRHLLYLTPSQINIISYM